MCDATIIANGITMNSQSFEKFWNFISQFQILSSEIIDKYEKYISWNYVNQFQQLSYTQKGKYETENNHDKNVVFICKICLCSFKNTQLSYLFERRICNLCRSKYKTQKFVNVSEYIDITNVHNDNGY